MKRLAALCICLLLLIPLAACAGDKEPDFQSLYDSQTKNMISLGETHESIVKKLGVGDLVQTDGDATRYAYCDGTLQLTFRQNQVSAIVAECLPRYKIYNYRDGTFLVEVKERFPDASILLEDGHQYDVYAAHYTPEGELVESADGASTRAEVQCENQFSRLVIAYEDESVSDSQ